MAEKTYIISVAPVGVIVEGVLTSNEHIESSFMFEVPEQGETFGLPTGIVRVVFKDFDILNTLGKRVKVSDIHDIEEAPELYARLAKMAEKVSDSGTDIDLVVLAEMRPEEESVPPDPYEDMSGCVNPNLMDPPSMHK